jgi:WD40 repeat protein
MNNSSPNPYVGPRTFLKNEGHLFFGRDREARDLLALVKSEKLVLFYAQSGAGKSSLINTRLIPGLETKGHEVLRVGRVGGEELPGIDIQNIYVFNLLRSLTHQDVQPGLLATLHLDTFLSGLRRQENEKEAEYFYDATLSTSQEKLSKRRVLIIDQFEELFSTHPEAWDKREDFFSQLAEAMENHPFLWVVLVMREDYIASLDPYAHLMPAGLRTRYYMQRLGQEAAIEAVRKPVENMRPYESGVAEKLVEDLSSIKVLKADGSQAIQPGQYVEAVQLQVVCYGLWQNLPENGTLITERDLLEVGDVDEALGRYYDGRVAEVAQTKHVKERLLRDWIQKKLIASGGIRSMVLRDTSQKSGGIRDDVIQALQSDLVRAENRGGTIWYELTHDRLVGPILESNEKWFITNLSPLQRQATLWDSQNRHESWLLRDQALAEVETWAADNPEELSEREVEFLAACRKQQEEIERKQREQILSARRLRTFLTVVTLLAIIAVGTAVYGFVQRENAIQNEEAANVARGTAQSDKATAQSASTLAISGKRDAENAKATAQVASILAVDQANKALAGNLAAQADSLKNDNYPLALLLGVEAYKRGDKNARTRLALFELLQFTPYTQLSGFAGPVSSLAISPDGRVIAIASLDKISLYDAELEFIRNVAEPTGFVYSLAFHQYEEQLVLAAGGCIPRDCTQNRGQLTMWEITNGRPSLINQEQAHTALIKTIAFSANGSLLATGSYDRTILIWDLSQLQRPKPFDEAPLVGHFSFVNSLVFSPDGKTLISAGDDRNLFLWDIAKPERARPLRKISQAHNAPISIIMFSPDGTKLASASDDNSVALWDWDPDSDTLQKELELKGHTGYVRSIAFQENQGQTILASAGFDKKILLWDAGTGKRLGPPLDVHSDAVNTIAFGARISGQQELPYLISGSSDRTITFWDLATRRPLSTSEATENLPEQETDTNGTYTATSIGQHVDLRDINNELFLRLSGFDRPVQYVNFQGQDLLTMYQDQFGTFWLTQWNIDPEEWVRLACEAVGRNLTDQEWKQFLPNQKYEKTCPGNS